MAANKTYTTVSGDMWDAIAYKLYGREALFPVLIKANPRHTDTVIFSAGVVLQVPDVDTSETALLPPWSES